VKHTRLAAAVFAIALVSPQAGGACCCAGAAQPKEALTRSSVVFRGVITDVQPAREWLIALRAFGRCGLQWALSGRKFSDCVQEDFGDQYYDIATFRVITTWKGASRAEHVVRTYPGGGNACGLSWRPDDEWVIYADEYESVLYSSACSRSRSGGWVYQESRDLEEAVSPP
jgi:hypothetical protein